MYMRNEIKNEEEQKLWKETIISGIALWIVLAVFMATNVNVHDFIFMMILNTMLIALGIFCYTAGKVTFAGRHTSNESTEADRHPVSNTANTNIQPHNFFI